MGYINYHHHFQREAVAQKALQALNGLGMQSLTNTDSNTFWWTSDSFKTRYRQEEAKVGDIFYDGNNGDRHQVLAVDLENSRIAISNLDQCETLVDIVGW